MPVSREEDPMMIQAMQIARVLHQDDLDRGRAAHAWGEEPDADEWYIDQANAVIRFLEEEPVPLRVRMRAVSALMHRDPTYTDDDYLGMVDAVIKEVKVW